ncbi:universal stress protein [Petropleomorpha daqingensis]|uniref:Nucleotide-binding universal stress UspA family protein n=1 Tax=Petropleomorpha daqingensis TaxID=2026353 RepID=A0A853CL08_9ACTN|nr:universal stress protein [Petropleomorpha daqingensis]NYJ08754.1 nucleotide-binding universal stress UspA family protein [Petropleomorpha daqingensis]
MSQQIVPPRSSAENRARVVVGLDGSAGSRAALEQAWLRAARSGAVLDVVSVLPVQHVWSRPAPDVQRQDEALADTQIRARALVDEVVSEGVAGAVEVRVRAVPGSPAGALVEAAEGAAALVVGSRGRGAVRSAVLGSVALHCVTHARCPVEVVHAAPDQRASGVVVGVDGSAESFGALRVAIGEAVARGTTVRVVAAWEVGNMWSDMYALTGPEKNSVRTRLQDAVASAVADAQQEAADVHSRPPLLTIDVAEGPPSDLLVTAAEGAELLVVGSRGHGAIRGLLLGSVALRCVVHAPCPVLVVPPPRRAAPAEEELAPATAQT